MPQIYERYDAYVAPAWVRPTVERLLSSVPEAHVQTVAAIVLTDAQSMTKARRARRGRNKEILGRYHPARHGEPPWIELIVDATISDVPKPMGLFQVVRDLTLGRVLFHEIGHHLEHTRRGIGRSGESTAIAWEKSLSRLHFRQHHSYLRHLAPVLKWIVNVIRRRSSTIPAAS